MDYSGDLKSGHSKSKHIWNPDFKFPVIWFLKGRANYCFGPSHLKTVCLKSQDQKHTNKLEPDQNVGNFNVWFLDHCFKWHFSYAVENWNSGFEWSTTGWSGFGIESEIQKPNHLKSGQMPTLCHKPFEIWTKMLNDHS